jgi:hypothetical protein
MRAKELLTKLILRASARHNTGDVAGARPAFIISQAGDLLPPNRHRGPQSMPSPVSIVPASVIAANLL